jgi:hypothetical protein
MSAEHYISKSVEVIGDRAVLVDGMPWLPRGERRELG